MVTPKCKVCGARHHRYEPHQFPAEQGQALPRARSTTRSPSRRNQGTGAATSEAPAHTATIPRPDTSDSEPYQRAALEPVPWSVIVEAMLERLPALSEENFRIIYNAVSAERMRRWRQKDKKDAKS